MWFFKACVNAAKLVALEKKEKLLTKQKGQ